MKLYLHKIRPYNRPHTQNQHYNCQSVKVGNKLNKASVVDLDDDENEGRNLPDMDINSDILEDDDIEQLRERLPTRLENNAWTLAFSTTRW